MSERSDIAIALFDVLGFEDRIRRYSLSEVHDQYMNLLRIAKTKGSHAFLDSRPTGDGRTETPFFGYIEIEQDYFSDTILLWTRFDPGRFRPFIHMCSAFICEALQARLPIRGALALGEAIMDKSNRTYLGKPLVEAARAEKAQQWIGLGLGRSFINKPDVYFSSELIRPFTRHGKPGSEDVLSQLVVDWPRAWRKEHGTSAAQILEHLSYGSQVPEYYRCAIEFVRQSDENPAWYKAYQPNVGQDSGG